VQTERITDEAKQLTERVLAQHDGLVYRVANQILRNEEDAKEIAQTVAILLMSNVEKIKPHAYVSWLMVTTKRRCFNFLRDKKAHWRIFSDLQHAENRDSFSEYESRGSALEERSPDLTIKSPDDLLAEENNKKIFTKILERLRPMHRASVKLILEDKTFMEEAEETNVPPGTVMSRRHRGKRKLAELLTEEYMWIDGELIERVTDAAEANC